MSPELLQARQSIEAKIEELIAMLDLLDGDPDLEDGGDDEPSIGSVPFVGPTGVEYDLEFDSSDDELTGDENEPEQGWSNPLELRVHVPEELKQIAAQGDVQ